MKHVLIFTDGACRGNPGPGGYGAIVRYGQKEKIVSGAESVTTNNRMELMAAIAGLSSLKAPCKVDLYTDSQYLQKGITVWIHAWKKNGWKRSDRKPIKNVDLWESLDNLVTIHNVQWHWVKGHNGHLENERADMIANVAIDELKKSN